jgi:pyrroloquinoline quinone (PQQ) biosynthesis protein C
VVQAPARVAPSDLAAAEQWSRDLVAETLRSPLSMDNHPFVRAVAQGKATRAQLIEFGLGTFRMVLDAQRWTAASYVQVDEQPVRQKMLRSMYEEETGATSGTDSHAELVADWLEALGLSREETYRQSKLLKPHAQAFASYSEFLGRCRPWWVYRGSISLAGEAHASVAFRTIERAMREHYSITDEKGLMFWTLHIPVDAEHTGTAVEVIAPYLTSEENRRELRHHVYARMDLRYRAWMEPLGEIAYSLREPS